MDTFTFTLFVITLVSLVVALIYRNRAKDLKSHIESVNSALAVRNETIQSQHTEINSLKGEIALMNKPKTTRKRAPRKTTKK